MHGRNQAFSSQHLMPLLILPGTNSSQTLAMGFFERISIAQLNEYQPCESWRNTLLLFSQTVSCVRHAATALSLIHRGYLKRHASDSQTQEESPWFHYSRAIQLLLTRGNDNSIETTAITLLVCYLLFCFDNLAGNDIQAMKHLRGGVEISRNMHKTIALSKNNNAHQDAALAGTNTLISHVTRQIRRLDMQAAIFVIDWTPADLQHQTIPVRFPSRIFTCLSEAAEHLQVLVARVMKIYWTEQQLSTAGETPDLMLKDVLLGQLQTWSTLFHSTLQQEGGHNANVYQGLEPLLRLQYTIAWTLLGITGPDREMAYDDFLPQFQQCVALAGDVHDRYFCRSAGPAFTPEVGLLPVLYIVGAKCRHPTLRREVLSILRRQPIREGLWDSISAAKVVERVIEIEEGGWSGSAGGRPAMGDIAAWQRVENLTLAHYGRAGSLERVDITYTFSGREGWHTESLVI